MGRNGRTVNYIIRNSPRFLYVYLIHISVTMKEIIRDKEKEKCRYIGDIFILEPDPFLKGKEQLLSQTV